MIIITLINFFFTFVYNIVFSGIRSMIFGGFSGVGDGSDALLALPIIGGGGFCGAIMAAIFAFIGAVIYAGIIFFIGTVMGTESDLFNFFNVIKTVFYIHVGQLAAIIPIVGGLISFVWITVLIVIGLTTIYNFSTGQALVIALLPLIFVCCCLGIMGVSIASLAGLGSMFKGMEGFTH